MRETPLLLDNIFGWKSLIVGSDRKAVANTHSAHAASVSVMFHQNLISLQACKLMIKHFYLHLQRSPGPIIKEYLRLDPFSCRDISVWPQQMVSHWYPFYRICVSSLVWSEAGDEVGHMDLKKTKTIASVKWIPTFLLVLKLSLIYNIQYWIFFSSVHVSSFYFWQFWHILTFLFEQIYFSFKNIVRWSMFYFTLRISLSFRSYIL